MSADPTDTELSSMSPRERAGRGRREKTAATLGP